jgi:RHS repeat-associated protein
VSHLSHPSGRTLDFERSGCACQVSRVSTTRGSITTTLMGNVSYRPFGGAEDLTLGGTKTVNNSYDLDGRLTVANPGAPMERSFTYFNGGQLHTVTAPNTPWYDRTFVYDGLKRLTLAEGPFGTLAYGYDDAGNRLSETRTGVSDTYAYVTGTNQLASITGQVVTDYGYDENGNVIEIGGRSLTYNQANQLSRVEENATQLGSYTYNGLGQRVSKTSAAGTTFYLYDFDGNLIATADASGAITEEHLYNGSLRLAMANAAGTIYYYHNNSLGTPELMTDATNLVVWEAIYDPFGSASVNRHSTVTNNFRFPGQFFDAETGYHYNWHRYYDPKTGRYLTPDPIGLAGGINPYVYVQNDPVNAVDPFGLERVPFRTLPIWSSSLLRHPKRRCNDWQSGQLC